MSQKWPWNHNLIFPGFPWACFSVSMVCNSERFAVILSFYCPVKRHKPQRICLLLLKLYFDACFWIIVHIFFLHQWKWFRTKAKHGAVTVCVCVCAAVRRSCMLKIFPPPASSSPSTTRAGRLCCAPFTASSTARRRSSSQRSSSWTTSATKVRAASVLLFPFHYVEYVDWGSPAESVCHDEITFPAGGFYMHDRFKLVF